MKKFYSIVLVALAVLFSANVQAVNVSNLTELKDALANGGEITLTANITTSEVLVVTKATTLNGNGYAIKSTDQYALQFTTDAVLNNVVIYAAKSKAGRGILIDDDTDNVTVTLNNVTINATERGLDVWYSKNVTLTINDSEINLVPNGGSVTDENTGMPSNYDVYDIKTTSVNSSYSRGVNIGQLTNSNITLNNTTIQGFFYNINNIGGTMEGCLVTATNCTFKGRAAVNVWGDDAEYVINDANVTGINNFKGAQESFASFVFNNNGSTICKRNKCTINGGTIVSAYFDATGMANPNARQFLIRDLGTDNVIEVNNAQYTCTKDADNDGNSKGGVIEYASATTTITINGGIYDCPEIVEGVYSSGDDVANITINGGTFNLNVVSADMTDGDVYRGIEINDGNFTIADTENGLDAEVDGNGLLGDDMAIVTNVDGSKTVMNTEDAANVETVDEDMNITEDTEKYLVGVKAGKKVVVEAGQTLTIGEGGVVFEDETAQIVVEDGGTVILNGNVNGNGNEESLVINASENTNTQFLINPNVNVYGDEHPMATFSFTTKSYVKDGKTVFQRFGMPTFDGTVNMTWENNAETMIYEYSAENGWGDPIYRNTTGSFTKTDAAPFTMFTMATNLPEGNNTVYNFTGRMMGNQNAQLEMVKHWNYFANSYTAAIDIKSLLNDVVAKYGSSVSATAYIYRSSDNMWDEVSLGAFELAEALPGIFTVPQTKIAPMQAFIIYMYSGDNETGEIDYETNVYNPGVGIANPAPARVASNNIDAAVQMTIATETYTDRMTLIEGAAFTDGFDNGYDAHKYMKNTPFNLYANNYEGQFGSIATDNLEGTILGFSAVQEGTYTITFNGNAAYALKDMAANRVVNMENGASYTFNAQAGQDDARFMVISRADAPTDDMQVIQNTKRAGIYTIAGQYVGETSILNTLPAGIYVVDGVKVVK